MAHPYAHKNHARLLLAYKQLRDSGGCSWPLVLRGDQQGEWANITQSIHDLGITDNVVWLPRLSVTNLVSLYSAATALIFPSLYEGCGQPVLEAMACGCPVVASNIPTTLEFAGAAAVTFDAISVEEITGAMQRVSVDSELRGRLRAEGLARARMYSQESTALRLMDAYKRAIVGCGH